MTLLLFCFEVKVDGRLMIVTSFLSWCMLAGWDIVPVWLGLTTLIKVWENSVADIGMLLLMSVWLEIKWDPRACVPGGVGVTILAFYLFSCGLVKTAIVVSCRMNLFSIIAFNLVSISTTSALHCSLIVFGFSGWGSCAIFLLLRHDDWCFKIEVMLISVNQTHHLWGVVRGNVIGDD